VALRVLRGSGLLGRLRAAVHFPSRFFAVLLRVSSRDLLVPGGVEGPRPGFADSSANHRLESARLADRAQVDVDENSAEHDQRGDIVQDVADRDRNSSEGSRARPQDNAGK